MAKISLCTSLIKGTLYTTKKVQMNPFLKNVHVRNSSDKLWGVLFNSFGKTTPCPNAIVRIVKELMMA